MDPNTFPTKGNLILAKNSLKLSRQGYELMDKKRNILIREMMNLINQAKDIQTQIDVTFRTAYAALQKANMEIGIAFVQQIAGTVPIENSIRIKTRSVMGPPPTGRPTLTTVPKCPWMKLRQPLKK